MSTEEEVLYYRNLVRLYRKANKCLLDGNRPMWAMTNQQIIEAEDGNITVEEKVSASKEFILEKITGLQKAVQDLAESFERHFK
jgi:hypothetical protein